jgi:hypothetical protein
VEGGGMKSKWLIEQRLRDETNHEVAQALRWVLESPECPMCNSQRREDLEVQIFSGNMTSSYLEAKNAWPVGIVEEHMRDHIEYEPEKAREIESARSEAITTLDMAEDVFSRIQTWLDEWEAKKDREGIDAEWLANATRLVGQANSSLKLIGTLKKEIGVDSQLLLAQQQVNGVMGILVDVLRTEPHLLNEIEVKLGSMALNPPSAMWEDDL